nr:glycoside hydrolase family 10 [Alkalibacterium sp.]
MENSTKFKLANGMMSALLVAPVFATATTALAQEADNEPTSEPEQVVVYENDFGSPDSLNHPIQDAGSGLTWSDDIVFEGNDNNSGVRVSNRQDHWAGIDVRIDGSLQLEDGLEYSVNILGYLEDEADIPEGSQLRLTTPESYTELDMVDDLAPGEAFILEATYTHDADADNDAFRVQSNDAGANLEFAIADILITTDAPSENEDPVEDDEDADTDDPTTPEDPVEDDGSDADDSIQDDDNDSEVDNPAELVTIYHDTFENDMGLAVQAGNATLTHLPNFTAGERTGAIHITDRNENHDGIDLIFSELGMDLGYEYNITVHGYVDEEETPGDGDRAVVQLPSGDYPVVGGADFVPGEEFTIEGTRSWTDTEYSAYRIQSSWVEDGRSEEISFYVTEVLIQRAGEVEDEEPNPDAPAAEAFTLIDFEDQELNGFEGRNGGELLEITDAENHTPDGQYSLHVSNRQDNWHGPSIDVTPYINVGETYEVSAWVKVDTESSQTITLSTQVGVTSPSYNNIESATLSAEDGWTEITGEYRYTSTGGGSVSVYLESSNVNLDFYVDDFNFEQVASDPIEVDLTLTPLQDVYEDQFTIGNIVSSPDLESPRVDLLTHHHSLVTAENAMKPDGVYDGREFDFDGVNSLVERVNEQNLDLHGHVLVWHSQSPDWHHTENGQPLSREQALENMRTHIRTVMENFGEIRSWDVVNEALDGSWDNPEDWRSNLRNTGWLRAIGDDYIYEAFKYARQVADENGWDDMVLYYNDYNDHVQGKARTMYYMVKEINEQWAEETGDENAKLISGLGMQGHYNIDINPENVKQSIERFEQLGIEIGITELDVTTNTSNQVVESELLRQAQIYARLFQIFSEHSDSIDRVTFWGLNDSNSWRSDRFPLLFDGSLRAKQAYYAVIDPDGFLEEYPLEDAVANQAYAVYGTPEVNAEIDDVWSSAPVLTINRMQQAHEILASGTARVLWDENNLYVLYQVTDSILDVSASAAHEQDSVEAFVNETGEETTSYIDGVGQYRVNYENEASFNPGRYSEGFRSETRLTGSGYIVEMAIPWKNVTPEAWHELGFDVQINDARDGARHGVAAWNDYTGGGWQDPSVFGNLTLVNSLDDIPPLEVEEGVQTPVSPGQVVVIGDGDSTVRMPSDLPQDTEILVEYVDADGLPTLEAAGGYTLIVAGEIVNITLIYPEGEEDFEGDFELTLGIYDEFVGEEVFVYYFNESEGVWEYVGGEITDNTISVNVTGFSMYGVFARSEEDQTDPDGDDEDDTDTDENGTDTGDGEDAPGTDSDDDTDVDGPADETAGDTDTDVDSDDDEETGERLPQTATAVWTIGLIGLAGMASGLGMHFLRKKK